MKSHARQYVEQMVKLFKSMQGSGDAARAYRALLDDGVLFKKLDTAASKRIQKERRMKTKQCFYNAQSYVLSTKLSTKEFDYYEGFATGVIPVHHAWLVDSKTGSVVDPTWAAPARGGLLQPECDYFGVKIPASVISKHWLKHKTADGLLFDYLDAEQKRRAKKWLRSQRRVEILYGAAALETQS